MLLLCLISQILSACIGQSCIYGNTDSQGNMIFTIHSDGTGWAGIGLGTSMANSNNMIVAFKNGNSYTISDRSSTSRSLPRPVDAVLSELVPLAVPAPSWATIAVSFKRSVTSLQATSTSSYIFASGAGVTTPTDRQSAFSVHGEFQVFGVLDFMAAIAPTGNGNGTVTPPTNTNTTRPTSPVTPPPKPQPILKLPNGFQYSTVVMLHGYILLASWALFPFIGIYIARFLKHRQWWYKLHLLIMFAGVLVLSLVGISLVFLYTSGPHFSTESSIHPLLGLITTILLVLQIILGFVIDALFDENRRSTPWYDVLHWWVGRLLSVLALATIVLGIVYFEKGYGESGMVMYITLAVFVAMGVGMMVYGQMNGGAKHHIKKE